MAKMKIDIVLGALISIIAILLFCVMAVIVDSLIYWQLKMKGQRPLYTYQTEHVSMFLSP